MAKYLLEYYDGQDKRERCWEIDIPDGEDPVVFARKFLSNWGELGKYGFEIRSIERQKDS